MQTYQTETTISKDGDLSLKNLPFSAGEKVEVIVKSKTVTEKNQYRYPLRGKPFRYSSPFANIAENDWEVNQ